MSGTEERHQEPDEHARRWEQVEEAVERLQEGAVEEAIERLGHLAEEHPENEYVWFFLGQAFFERERWDKALKGYVEALARAPRFLGAMIGAGHCLLRLGKPEKALRMARQALLAERDDTDALYLLGMAHLQMGRLHAAAEAFERFLAGRPELEVALEVRAILERIRSDERG